MRRFFNEFILKIEMSAICIFGDSIVWGASDLEKGGWVNRLRLFFDKQGKDMEVYNLGIPGDTTGDLLDRLEAEIKSRLDEETIILFSIGINDSIHLENLEFFKDNLQDLMGVARKFSKKILFLGLTNVDEKKTIPVNWDKEAVYINKNIKIFDNQIKEIVEKEKVNYFRIFDLLNKNELEDGLHPNSKGHEKIFEAVKSYLIKELI
jgi:acyl-CoA thioesterase I